MGFINVYLCAKVVFMKDFDIYMKLLTKTCVDVASDLRKLIIVCGERLVFC